MSLTHPDPTCTVNATSTLNGVNAAGSSSITIALSDTAGVKQWNLSVINTDETNVAATLTAALVIDLVTKTATLTVPAGASALIFQSRVNNGLASDGTSDPTLTTTFGVYVLTATGLRVGAFDEKTEGSAAFGWTSKMNAIIRNGAASAASYGDGLQYSAGVVSVKPAASGYVLVTGSGVAVDATTSNDSLKIVARDSGGGIQVSDVTCTTIQATGLCTLFDAAFGNDIDETRVLSQHPILQDGTGWTYSTDSWMNTIVGKSLEIHFDPPHGSIINSFTVNYRGAGAHVGLPAVMPTISLCYYDQVAGGTSTVANSTKADPSGTTGAFQASHSFTSDNAGAGIGHMVDRSSRRYYVLVTAESGVNSLVGALWDGVRVTWQRPQDSKIGQD